MPMTEMTFGELTFAGRGTDSLGSAESAFILLLGIRGVAKQHMGRRQSEISPARGALHNPGHTAVVHIENTWQALSISIRREILVRELENHLGHPVSAPIEFSPSMNMNALGGMGVWQNALTICQLMQSQVGTPPHLLASRDAQRSMISHLVDSHRHNYTRLMNRTAAAGPWQVRAAEEFIRANSANAISIGDLASIVGISARTLQHSFRRHRGISPMQFLRDIRLQGVHADLLWDGNVLTVAEAAAKWGFYHFGRFAAAYGRRHGESPSETLRRKNKKHFL